MKNGHFGYAFFMLFGIFGTLICLTLLVWSMLNRDWTPIPVILKFAGIFAGATGFRYLVRRCFGL